jgi:hypothetical protein
MNTLIATILLLFLLACSQTVENTNSTNNTTNVTLSTRDPTVCPQLQQANSGLNFIFVFHHLQENTEDYYYNQSIAYLKSVDPFKNEAFNTYRIDLDRTLCWPKGDKTVVRSQLECDWPVLNQKLIACGVTNERIIIISGDEVQTVSVPTYYENSFSVIQERELNRYNFLHEVGHLFGLQEEYIALKVRQTSQAYRPRKPNCAANMTEAREWWGADVGLEGTGYYEGCAGHLNYYKPNKDTLMSEKAKSDAGYGYVSTQYLVDTYNCCYAANRTAYACDTFFTTYPEWQRCVTG